MLVRFTIGPVQPAGFDCLRRSVAKMALLYPRTRIVICHNHLAAEEFALLAGLGVELLDQKITKIDFAKYATPLGVAWKLYPPRLDPAEHEVFLDNDILLERRLEEIDWFLAGKKTLLLEGDNRLYGRFERHVPPNFVINSGIFGLPPGFDLAPYMRFYAQEWEENCEHASRTWDEQGFVAASLLTQEHIIIPETKVINCENRFSRNAAGFHFVGLNRRSFHRPYAEYKASLRKLYL